MPGIDADGPHAAGPDLVDSGAPLYSGRRLGARYELVRPIARGGMAEVWEGRDAILRRAVAVKVLQTHLASDVTFVERFRREAVTAARVAHPCVVATYDAGVDAGTAYIVMELVPGQTLRQLLTASAPLDPGLAVAIALQIADALANAHRAGLVHRDIKPANILLCDDGGGIGSDGGGVRVKVTDFGIAKVEADLGADLTQVGTVLGTPKYLSPEQVEGRVEPDARSDLYALGVVLFEMLTGRPPFNGRTGMATALAHLREPPAHVSELRPELGAGLDAFVDRLLAKSPADRPPTALAARQALDALVRNGLTVTSGPVGSPGGLRPVALSGPVGLRPAAGGGPGGDMTPNGRRPDLGDRSAHRPPAGDPTVLGRSPDDPTVLGRSPGDPYARTPPTPSGDRRALGARVTGTTRLPSAERSDATLRPPSDVRAAPAPPEAEHVGAEQPAGASGRTGPVETTRRPPATAGATPARRRRRARVPGLLVAAVVLVAVIVAGILIADNDKAGRRGSGAGPGTGPATTTTSLAVDGVTVWMNTTARPPDNPGETGNVIDGKASTAWETDHYTSPIFGGYYSGMGLAIHLRNADTLVRLVVDSPTHGWSASTYVATTEPARGRPVTAWGAPTASAHDIAGNETFRLGGRKGRWVLLWLTDLGPSDQVSITEVSAQS